MISGYGVSTPGYGGGTAGSAANRESYGYVSGGNGGTATSGGTAGRGTFYGYSGSNGSFGVGGSVTQKIYARGGGGGGGWYGGGSGVDDYYSSQNWILASSGGGGSGYVYTSSTASQYPSGCLLNSSYYLTNASTTGNSRSGNGYATITLIE